MGSNGDTGIRGSWENVQDHSGLFKHNRAEIRQVLLEH